MSTQFFSSLSKNYIEILEDDKYFDITVEVGNGVVITWSICVVYKFCLYCTTRNKFERM